MLSLSSPSSNNNHHQTLLLASSTIMGLISVIGMAICISFFQQHHHQESNQLRDDIRMLSLQLKLEQQQQQQQQTNDAMDSSSISRQIQQQQQQQRQRQLSTSQQSSQLLASSFTLASDFGVVGDAETDDTAALQAALDSAKNGTGGTVLLGRGVFRTFSRLIIPPGVTLRGQGYGRSPLAIKFDAGGTTIAYCGTDYAVGIEGHASGLEDLAVYDWRYPVGSACDLMKAKGGVLIEGNGNNPEQPLTEGVVLKNLLLYWFMGGTSLTIRGVNGGGVLRNHVQNVRVRHAHTGIRIETDDSTSVANSMSFLGGAISGGITYAGIIVNGTAGSACNDHKFYGMVIEPGATELAHVYVEGESANIKLVDVRLEGSDMDDVTPVIKPLIIIHPSSYGNEMTGMLGHTHIQADFQRNPGIDLLSAKSVGLDPIPQNQLWNAAFAGLDADQQHLPGWAFEGDSNNVVLSVLPEVEDEVLVGLYPNHRILHIEYSGTSSFKLKPHHLPAAPAHSHVTFGIYVRQSTSQDQSIQPAMRYESGSYISGRKNYATTEDEEWQFVSMSALYDKSQPHFFFRITGTVDVTAPVFLYGKTPATPGGSLLSSSGVRMAGTLSVGVGAISRQSDQENGSCYKWKLPKGHGNVFPIETTNGSSCTIARINDSSSDRFPAGTVLTLVFSQAGIRVLNGSYLKLFMGDDFVTSSSSSITLVSSGGASWTEVGRSFL